MAGKSDGITMTVLVAIVGGTNSGKTTLIEKLVPVLLRRGFRVGTVKHAKHGFVPDQAGKDSRRHASAGAETVVVDAGETIVMFRSLPSGLSDMDRLKNHIYRHFEGADIVIVEGYKGLPLPKIEVYRRSQAAQPICSQHDTLLAVASDDAIETDVSVYGLDDIESIADMIVSLEPIGWS